MLRAEPMTGQVAAVSVGRVQGQALVDLDYPEDSACDADMNIVMTGASQFVEVQGTAEGQVFSRTQLDELLDLASGAIAQLHRFQQQALEAA